MPRDDYLVWMLAGYLLSVAVETPVLVALLSRRHPVGARVFAGVWLTACTYPVVWLVLPPLFGPDRRWTYLLAAETFAPAAECAIFWFAFVRPLRPPEPDAGRKGWEGEAVGGSLLARADERPLPAAPPRWATARDCAAVTAANLCSFGVGEVLTAAGVFGG